MVLAEIGLSVTRAGSFVLGLGTLEHAPGTGMAIEHDPRVDEAELARDIRCINQPGTHIVWLDPQKPRELQARLRELDGDLPGVNALAIVARTDSNETIRLELNRRTMLRHRRHLRAVTFLTASERFTRVDEWLVQAAPCHPSDRRISGCAFAVARKRGWFPREQPPPSIPV